MSATKTTPSQENYVEWIYRLSARGPVRPSQLAEQLGVRRPSATRAVAALVKKGLVEHEPYGDIQITEAGRAMGEAIVRRDECLTELLVHVLGMSPVEADPEVHRLEHVLSDEVLGRLEVLVRLAASSDAWLKKLHQEISETLSQQEAAATFRVGGSDIHPGSRREKRR